MARRISFQLREAIGCRLGTSRLTAQSPASLYPEVRAHSPVSLLQVLLAVPLAAIVFVQSSSFAQQPGAPAPVAAPAPAPGTAAPAQKGAPTQQELDQLLAPIALYPDNLIAQILMASTYPLEVVEAARWAEANNALKDKALEDALQKQPWDPAVKALVAVPQVLKQMNDNLSWMQKLGDAFLGDEAAVLATVQSLRGKAQAAGNLKSTPEQNVKTETQAGKTVYIIEPAKPEVVYVPAYNPATIYGYWPPAYPPYYVYPPAYPYGAGLAFATGVVVGAAIWGNCNWGGNNVNVNVNNYNKSNRTNINNGNWNHNTDHRKGVSYGNSSAADKYGRGSQGAQGRDQYRGREGGAGGDRGAGVSDRSAGGNRGAGGGGAGVGDRSAGGAGAGGAGAGNRGGAGARAGNSGGGFSGVGAGASTTQASSRGSASRSSSMGSGGGGASHSMSGGGGGARAGGGGGGGRGGGGGGGRR